MASSHLKSQRYSFNMRIKDYYVKAPSRFITVLKGFLLSTIMLYFAAQRTILLPFCLIVLFPKNFIVIICTVPFHLLVGRGTEEISPVAGLRAEFEHKGFSQGKILPHLSSLQLHC